MRLLLSRSSSGCSSTSMYTWMSPGIPAFFAACPLPSTFSTIPSITPAGIFISITSSPATTPSPLHFVHLFLMVFPVPPHCGHAVCVCMRPSMVSTVRVTYPEPLHCEQVSCRPSSLPVPLQCWHATFFLTLNFLVVPVATSFRVIFTFKRRSAPLDCCLRRPPPPPNPPNPPNPCPPKMSPNMLKMSSMFMLAPPPNPPFPPIPACPNWSYLWRFSGSCNTSYASAASLNFSSASLLSGLRSG